MPPPESSASEILYEAVVKVEGPPGEPIAFMSVSKLKTRPLYIAPNWIGFFENQVDLNHKIDMTEYQKITINYRRGLMSILVNDQVIIQHPVDWEIERDVDSRGGDPSRRTQFGQYGEEGQSYWKRVSYSLNNQTFSDYNYNWNAGKGEWPDQYQRDRMIQIHANPPNQREGHYPDHGYSSWIVLDDGRIMFVDYTNFGDPQGKSHLVGTYIKLKDIQ